MTTYTDEFRDPEDISTQELYLITESNNFSCNADAVIGVVDDEDKAMHYEKEGCYVWLIQAKLMERKSTEEW